ncbi:hypothetical protein [Kosakonia sp. H7A]|nr:hypothetical protein [Kosakonia sp. H7A]
MSTPSFSLAVQVVVVAELVVVVLAQAVHSVQVVAVAGQDSRSFGSHTP